MDLGGSDLTSSSKAHLQNIFGSNSSSSSNALGGNAALRYTAPKEPPKQHSTLETSATQQTPSQQTSTIIHSVNVYLHKYDQTSRSYQPQGNGILGCVIVGMNTSYNLLFYNAQKQHVCVTTISAQFQYTLQPNNYVNFYDSNSTNWSIRFSNESETSGFVRILSLTKAHVGIWGQPQLPGNRIYKDEITLGKSSSPISIGDTAGIKFSAWKVVGTVASRPLDITKQTPFHSSSADNLRRVKIGDKSEVLPGLEEGIIGMAKGSKRLLVVPPSYTGGQDWLIMEVEVMKLKSMRKTASTPEKPSSTFTSTFTSTSTSTSTSATSSATSSTLINPIHSTPTSSDPSLVNRMAHLSRAASSNLIHSPGNLLNSNRLLAFDTESSTIPSSADATFSSTSTSSSSLVGGPIVPYDPTPGTPKALQKEKQKLLWQQEEVELQKKALEEARAKMIHEQLAIQRQQIELQQQQYQQHQHQHQQHQHQQHQQHPSDNTYWFNSKTNSGTTTSSSSSMSIGRDSFSRRGGYEDSPLFGSKSMDSLSHHRSNTTSNSSSSNFYLSEIETLHRIQRMTSNMEGSLLDIHGKMDRLLSNSMSDRRHLSYYSSSNTINTNSGNGGSGNDSLLEGIERLVMDNERMSRDIGDRGKQLSNMERRIDELNEKNRQLIMENNRLMERSSEMHQQQTLYSSQLALSQSATQSRLEDQIEQLQSKLRNLDMEKLTLLESVSQHTNKESTKMKQIEHLEQENSTLQNSIQLLQTKIKNLEDNANLSHLKVANMLDQEQVNQMMLTHQVALKTLKEQFKKEAKERILLAREEGIALGKQQHEQEVQRLQEEITKNTLQQQQQEITKNTLQKEELQRLQEELQRLQEELNAQQQDIQAQQQENMQTQQQKDMQTQQQQEMDALREQYAVLEKSKMESEKRMFEALEEARLIKAEAEELLNAQNEQKHTSIEGTSEVSSFKDQEQLQMDQEKERNEKVAEIFKDLMNEIYFKFQDAFEEDNQFTGKEVIVAIRRILKQNTIEVLQKLDSSTSD